MITAKEALEQTKEVLRQKRQARIDRAIETINDAIKESIEEGRFSTCGKLSCIYGQEEVDALLKYFQDLEYTLSITIFSDSAYRLTYAWEISWEEY